MRKFFPIAAALLCVNACAAPQSAPQQSVCAPDHLTTFTVNGGSTWGYSPVSGRIKPGTPIELPRSRAVTGHAGVDPTHGVVVGQTSGEAPGGYVIMRMGCTFVVPTGKQEQSSPGTAGWIIHFDPFHSEDKARAYYGLPPTDKPAISITPIPNPPPGTYPPHDVYPRLRY